MSATARELACAVLVTHKTLSDDEVSVFPLATGCFVLLSYVVRPSHIEIESDRKCERVCVQLGPEPIRKLVGWCFEPSQPLKDYIRDETVRRGCVIATTYSALIVPLPLHQGWGRGVGVTV